MIATLLDNNLTWAAERARADANWLQHRDDAAPPDYLWIGCSDSRIPAHELVGLEPGELLVHRNIANLAPNGDLNLLAVLQLALETLKVRHIIVCGHTGCRSVHLALDKRRHGVLDHWLRSVRRLGEDQAATLRAVRDPETRTNIVAEWNVVDQVRSLAGNPLVRDAWRRRQPLTLHGWMHAIRDGLLSDLEVSVSSRADAARLLSPAPATQRRLSAGRRP